LKFMILLLTPLTRSLFPPYQSALNEWNGVASCFGFVSDVLAGHDNCNYDSYERQLERTLTPLFAAYGQTIEVRWSGWWVRRQLPKSPRHRIGDDVDAVHYTWTYFEQRDAAAWHELFVRWALLLPNAPFVIDVGVGPTEGEALFDAYSKFGFNTLYLQRGLAKHLGWVGVPIALRRRGGSKCSHMFTRTEEFDPE